MGEYANISSKKLSQFLQWLSRKPGITLDPGGRHNIKVQASTGSAFPLPLSHREVNKYIVKGFRDWLVKGGVCTQEEFDEHIT